MKSNLLEILENDFSKCVFISSCAKHSVLVAEKMACVRKEGHTQPSPCAGVLNSESRRYGASPLPPPDA